MCLSHLFLQLRNRYAFTARHQMLLWETFLRVRCSLWHLRSMQRPPARLHLHPKEAKVFCIVPYTPTNSC